MDGVRTSAWWWLCAALVAVAAKAQEPQRRPLLGRVLDATGAPLEHAQVMFVGLESGLAVDTARDVVEATSGDRGRYRAMLLPGLPYFGFACGPTTADGQMTFAEVRGWFGAGAIVDFRCTSSAPLQTAAIRGLEAWNDDGPLQRFVRPSFHGGYLPMPFAIAAPSAADGSSPWPSMPRGFVELRRADGSMFWISPPALDPGKDFVVPPPREVRCRVVDTAGAPVSGASLHLRTLASHDGLVDGIETMRGVFEYPVGTTEKDGVAVLRLPFPDDAPPGSRPSMMIVARCQGFAEQLGGTRGADFFVDGRKCEERPVGEWPFRLQARPPIAGTVRIGEQPAPPGTVVRLRAVAKLYMANNSYMHDPRQYVAQVGADGAFAMEDVPTDLHSSQWLVHRAAMQPAFVLPMVVGRAPSPQVDIGDIATLAISVFDTRSGPASGRAIYLQRLGGARTSAREGVIRAVVDNAGRARIDLGPGDWQLHCFDDDGFGSSRLVVGEAGEHAVEVRMRAFPRIRGFLHTADGKPVTGAKFELRTTGRTGGKQEDALLASWFGKALPQLLAAAEPTGADGSFSLVASPVDSIRVVVRANFEGRTSDDLELVVGESPDTAAPQQLRLR